MSNIDMTAVKSPIVAIFKVLKNELIEVSKYRKDYARWTSSEEYNSDYIAKKISELTSNIRAYALNNLKDLEKLLNDVLKAGQENEKVFNMDDPKLQASIQLINTVGKAMDYQTRDNIVRSFIGDQQALIMIRSLFEAKDIDRDLVRKYIFSFEDKVDQMKELIIPLTYEAEKSMYNITKLAGMLKGLAALCGFELSETEADLGIDENEYLNQLARASLGMSPVE